MQIVTFQEFEKDLEQIINHSADEFEPVFIKCANKAAAMVVLPLSVYESLTRFESTEK